jgi:uncharacterized protein
MTSETLTEERADERQTTAVPIIDTDVHESFRSHRDLIPYLDEPWRGLIERGAWKGMTGRPYAFWSAGGGLRVDAKPESDEAGHAASSYEMMRQQLLDLYNIERVILTGYFYPAVRGDMQVEFSTALASAYNDFLIDEWLNKDERFRSSIHVAPQDPDGAGREIERLGEHPQFVQVMLPMGKRGYGATHSSSQSTIPLSGTVCASRHIKPLSQRALAGSAAPMSNATRSFHRQRWRTSSA